MKPTLNLEPLTPKDLDHVSDIERVGGDVGWTRGHFEKELTLPMSRFFVLRDGSNILGYGGYWKVIDEAQITNLVVVPAQRRKGHGQALLQALMECAERDSCTQVTLEVRSRNAAALALYQKLGFKIQARRPKIYTLPDDDAILMEKEL